jgi:hypothetical protein
LNLTASDSFDLLFEPAHVIKPLPPGFIWKVIFDPTRTPEEPGLFYGSVFRFIDIAHDRNEICTWPEGIIFENINTGEFLVIRHGQIHYPDKQTEIEKLKGLQTSAVRKREVVRITIIGQNFNHIGDEE